MTTTATIFFAVMFWGSLLAVAFSYAGYPVLLKWLARHKKPSSDPSPAYLPTVSVLFAAYNEARVMAEKMETLLRTHYPAERLEILIGNDASTDATAEIISRFIKEQAGAGIRIRLVNFAGRTGKPQIINALVEEATGEILVLTDANIMFTPETITQLVQSFADERVGFVAGNILGRQTAGDSASGISAQEDAYIRRETQIKYNQSLLSGVVIAPFGACYAMRKTLYRPVPPRYNVDDFYLSMHILWAGYRAVQRLDAVCYEDVSTEISEEFRRKKRIATGNWQNLAAFWPVLFRINALSFHFLSHKVLRWLTPFYLLAAAIAGLLLGWNGGTWAQNNSFYFTLLMLQGCAWAAVPLDILLVQLGVSVPLLRFVRYFIEMNMALLQGFWSWVVGVQGNIWEPTKRNT